MKLPKIHLKMLRDLKAAKFQFGAVVLVIMIGISLYIGSYSAYLNLNNSYEHSFDLLNMGDYWINLDEVSSRAVTELDSIPGVTAQGRVVGTVQIDLGQDTGARIEGRVISLPQSEHPLVNNIMINSGSYFSRSPGREILMEKHFADWHKLRPGDSLMLEREGIRGMFTIAGVISSPEYIFVTKSEQDVMPLPRTFGVLFMAQPAAEKLFSMEGRVNEINLLVDNGVSHAEVSQKIEETLLRFGIRRVTFKNDPVSIETRKIDIVRGVRSAYVIEREDQIVNKLLKQDLESFQQMAFLFPMLFLSIASFTIYVLLSRLVESQRVQIGLMRGLGYTRLGILLHYTAFALIIGITGALLGALLGNYIGSWMTRFYVAQLNLPLTVINISWSTTVGGIITGIAIPVIAGFIPAWSTMRLTPAIAMRPAAPASGHKLLIERILPFLSRMPYIFKLTLRNIFRRFRQTLFMALGVAFAVTLILVSLAFVDTFNNALYSQYDVVQQYDAVIYYQGMGSAATANYVQRLDGVERAEAVFQVPYRLRYRDTIVDTAVTGLPPASTMFNLKSPQGEKLEIADGGILLPQYLKRRFGAEIGDIVELEPLVGTVGSTQKQIIGYVDFFMGGRAFMSLSEVQEMTRSSGMATGIMMQFHSQPSEELIKRLYDLPGTASIEFVEDTRQYIDDQMAFFWAFIIFMLVMGTSLGVAIIFNSVTVNVLQRTREIAVMRVIGRRNIWITSIITMENIIVGLFGVIIGIPLGQYVAYYFMSTAGSMSEEAMTLNLYIGAHSYIIAVAMAMLMLLVSQMPAINQVRKMSLTTALKDWYE